MGGGGAGERQAVRGGGGGVGIRPKRSVLRTFFEQIQLLENTHYERLRVVAGQAERHGGGEIQSEKGVVGAGLSGMGMLYNIPYEKP